MEFIAKSEKIMESPQKVRSIVRKIKEMPIDKALALLTLWPKKGARPLFGTLKTATANAKSQKGVAFADLKIKTILVNSGSLLKRQRPRARGQADLIRRRTSQIVVILESIAKKEKGED